MKVVMQNYSCTGTKLPAPRGDWSRDLSGGASGGDIPKVSGRAAAAAGGRGPTLVCGFGVRGFGACGFGACVFRACVFGGRVFGPARAWPGPDAAAGRAIGGWDGWSGPAAFVYGQSSGRHLRPMADAEIDEIARELPISEAADEGIFL